MSWRVLLVHKRSNLEAYARKWGRQTRAQRAALQRVFGHAHDAHERTVDAACAALEALGASFDVRLRDELRRFDERRYDLVVTVGGDGTLLSVAPFLRRTPVLAVNSSPKTSVGFFAAASQGNVRRWLARIAEGREASWALQRMEVRKGGAIVGHPVLNDVLFAHPSPVMTTRHWIKPPDAKNGEEQKSSGIWISTPSGSTSAARAAGGVLLPLEGKDIQYIVREPYVSVGTPYGYVKGIIRPKQKLLLESRLPKGCIYMDGQAHEEIVGFGDRLSFALSPSPLLLYGRSPVMRAIHGG